MGLGPENMTPFSCAAVKPNGGDSRICAFHLQNVVAHTVNVSRPSLDKAVGQPLHVPNLVSFSISVFLVVISKN